jgi:transposase IS116/IS110/IS902 family protein
VSTVIATTDLEPLQRLTRDLANAAKTLSPHEARFLVDAYYIMQKNRIAAAHQVRTLNEGNEPHAVLDWLAAQSETLESQVKRALDKWTDSDPVGIWAKSICGIGPVISAGLLAHIDITRCETAGHIWSFAGLNPEMAWKKGEKRPFNASLKTLCAFKLGESFVKVQGNDNDVYGKVFAARKKIEQETNDRLGFAGIAEKRAATVGKSTEGYKAYSTGKLPPAHIHARARRYAVKLFLSHYHMVAYFVHHQKLPPFPYVFSHLEEHVHFISPPNADLIDGLIPALKAYEDKLRKR